MKQNSRSLNTLPFHRVRFLPFADGGVLLKEGTRKLLVLNQSAAVIWCLLAESASRDALITNLSKRYAIDRKTAKRDAESALDLFDRTGFLATEPAETEDDLLPWPQLVTSGPEIDETGIWAYAERFQLHAHLLEVRCQHHDIVHHFSELMRHLRVNTSASPTTRIAILKGKEQGWDMYLNGRILKHAVPTASVLPLLLMINFVRSSDAMADKLLFHAAVVASGQAAILLPGITTSGKTTLAAALAQRGYTYFSDELAVINRENQQVSPYPLPMSIKPGSVPVLEPLYSGLSNQMVYLRADDKKVRYIIPLQEVATEGDTARVGCILFPQFVAEISTELRELPKAEALNLLVRTGSSNRELTARDVEVMIDLVEQAPCYALTYANLDEAVAAVDNILIKLNR